MWVCSISFIPKQSLPRLVGQSVDWSINQRPHMRTNIYTHIYTHTERERESRWKARGNTKERLGRNMEQIISSTQTMRSADPSVGVWLFETTSNPSVYHTKQQNLSERSKHQLKAGSVAEPIDSVPEEAVPSCLSNPYRGCQFCFLIFLPRLH